MKWTQVDVKTPEAFEEVAIACLMGSGCSGVQVIRQEDLPQYDTEWSPTPPGGLKSPHCLEPQDVVVRGFLPAGTDPSPEILSAIARADLLLSTEAVVLVTEVQDDGWSRSWRRYFRPMRIGRRLVIVPSWERYKARKKDIVISLDPGMAFGTGHHATTRLCLQAMETRLVPGNAVIDVGCGSGILSIAAARLGARQVLALDMDPIAAATTRENIVINQVAGCVEVRADTLRPPYSRADLVVANILAPIIIELLPAIVECLNSERESPGLFLASGIVRSQEGAVTDAFNLHGLTHIESLYSDEWVCLVGQTRIPLGGAGQMRSDSCA